MRVLVTASGHIGSALVGSGKPFVSISPDDAREYLGLRATFAHLDNPTSGALPRAQLGWQTTIPGSSPTSKWDTSGR